MKCLYNVVELFIFRFISDLGILPTDISFTNILDKARIDPEEALDFYAKNTRKKIYKLFPPGTDGTTIINGTIFVAENGEANLSQAILFRRSLEHLNKYGEEFGSLTKIDKAIQNQAVRKFLAAGGRGAWAVFHPSQGRAVSNKNGGAKFPVLSILR